MLRRVLVGLLCAVLAASNAAGTIELQKGLFGINTENEEESTEAREETEREAESTETPEETEIAAESTEAPEETEAEAESTEETEAESEEETEEIPEAIHILMEKTSTNGTGYDESGNYKRLYEYTSVQFNVSDEDREKYPELQEFFDTFNEEQCMKDKSTLEYFAENAENADITFSEEVSGTLLRADSVCVSIMLSYYSYMGGAHPNTYTVVINLDPKTGKRLALSDVVTDEEAFISAISNAVAENYGEETEAFFTQPSDYLSDIDFSVENANFIVGTEGITYIFNPYTLSSYAAGEISGTVYYDSMPKIFRKKYTRVPSSYALPFAMLNYQMTDVDDDGMRDFIEITSGTDEYGYYENFFIDVNGRQIPSGGGFRCEAYLFSVEGTKFAGTYISGEDDYCVLYLYDLSDEDTYEIEQAEPVLDGHPAYRYLAYDYSDEVYSNTVEYASMLDPTDLPMTTKIDVLGSYQGTISYCIFSDGDIVSLTEGYEICTSNALQTITTLWSDDSDVEGIEESTKLRKGTYIVLVGTDAESYCDFQIIEEDDVEVIGDEYYTVISLKDGTYTYDPERPVYRFEIERLDWKWQINEMPEDECLIGIAYAG